MTLDELKIQNPELHNLYLNYNSIIKELRMNNVLDYADFKHIFNAVALAAKQTYAHYSLNSKLMREYMGDAANMMRQYHIYKEMNQWLLRYNHSVIEPKDMLVMDIQDAFVDFPYFKVGPYHYCFAEQAEKLVVENGEKIGGVWLVQSDEPLVTITFKTPTQPIDNIYFELLYPNPKLTLNTWKIFDQIIQTNSTTTTVQVHGVEHDGLYYVLLGDCVGAKDIDFSVDNTTGSLPIRWQTTNTKLHTIDYYSDLFEYLHTSSEYEIQAIPKNNVCIAQNVLIGRFDDEI